MANQRVANTGNWLVGPDDSGYLHCVSNCACCWLCCFCVQVAEVTIVRDRHSGESKGFGFVRMGTEQGAAAALQALDNYLIGEGANRPVC
jgi:RNA recognition motif-containing protein